MNDLSPASDAVPAAAGTAPAQTAALAFATEPGAQGTLREGASGTNNPRRNGRSKQPGGEDEGREGAALDPQGAVEVGAELGELGFETGDIGLCRRFEADDVGLENGDIGLCREHVVAGSGGGTRGVHDGLGHRFIGAGIAEHLHSLMRIKHGGIRVDSFRPVGNIR